MSAHIRLFTESVGWLTLLAMLPMGVLFGAAHALTPGNSKAVGRPIGVED